MSLVLVNLLESLVDVCLLEFPVKTFDLGHILMGLPQSGQRRRLQASPFRVRRQISIGFGAWGVVLLLQLVPQQVEEELLERLGPQSRGIVRGSKLDEVVLLKKVGDAVEGLLVETVFSDAAEQEQRFEGSVSVAARGSHAPDSTSPEIEGTVTPLRKKVNRRHDLGWSVTVSSKASGG